MTTTTTATASRVAATVAVIAAPVTLAIQQKQILHSLCAVMLWHMPVHILSFVFLTTEKRRENHSIFHTVYSFLSFRFCFLSFLLLHWYLAICVVIWYDICVCVCARRSTDSYHFAKYWCVSSQTEFLLFTSHFSNLFGIVCHSSITFDK